MPYKSKAQQRYFFAAESRGELPSGIARRWANETPNIKKLPERKMKKEAMFFEEQLQRITDGMFMKEAQFGDISKTEKPLKVPQAPPKPEKQLVQPGEQKKTVGKQDPPKTVSMGHGGSKCAMLGIPKTGQLESGAMNMLPPDGSGASQFGPQTAPQMGTGKAPKGAKKQAAITDEVLNAGERSGKRLGQTGKALLHGTKETLKNVPTHIEGALKYVENLPPAAQAAIVAGTGYAGVKKLTRGLGRITGRVKPGAMARTLSMIRRLRGR